MSSVIVNTASLIITIFTSFLLSHTIAPQYDLQLTAGLFILYFVIKKLSPDKKLTTELTTHRLLNTIIFTLIIMNTVLSTGGLSSPFFFLIYFLMFAIALILQPVVSIATSFALILLFLADVPSEFSWQQLIPIFSLPFLTPFALFLGREYRKNIYHQKRFSLLQTKDKLLQEEMKDAKEDAMIFLSVIIKSHLKTIRDLADNFRGDHELDKIRKSTRRMEKLIDEFESNS